MSIHKLTAGSGYTYLTRQVATQDADERGHNGLASYYTANGETPGVWVGSGMAGLEGLSAGDEVTAEQMTNLFSLGIHPLSGQLEAEAAEAGLSVREQVQAKYIGKPFPLAGDEVSQFRRRVAVRVGERNAELGLPTSSAGSLEVRARIRTQVALEMFRDEHARDPADEREIAATIARHSRPRTSAVAGFDLTFSPVKSVSALWAVAPAHVAAAIERAHNAAVQDALAYLEKHATYTREGHQGARQVETRGLIAAAFTHRDSRAGDPDLHTHVAVSNKVQTKDGGRWLALDGRVLYKANVAASETYNTRLEHHLRDALGLVFTARPNTDARKRPVREIVGVDPALNERWSARRASIETRRAQLATAFQADHGRPPTPIESIQLAQRATLETRQGKHAPRSLTEQRAAWAAQARDVLGGQRGVDAMVRAALTRGHRGVRIDAAWMNTTAAAIADTVQARRSHWQRWHVEAEALRRVRSTDLPLADLDRVVDLLVDQVLATHSIALTRPRSGEKQAPDELKRSTGESVYRVHRSTMFSSAAILAAEQQILDLAGRCDGARLPAGAVEAALRASADAGRPLNAGQATLVQEMATSGARVQLAIAPAGAGKTTAMRALAAAWTSAGGQVLGFAPSAAAASVLAENMDGATDTMAKLIWHLEHDALANLPQWAASIGPRTLVVIDEAGMADTLSLARVITFVTDAGASVRLIGDDQQLAAVGAGGVLRDIQARHGALHLSELMRFTDAAEGAASLALRDGAPEALGFYLDRGRVHVGDLATLTEQVFTAWRTERDAGRDAIMLSPTRELAPTLNQRAQGHRLATPGTTQAAQARLADGSRAGVGDLIITRTNDRGLRIAATDWVKNGDRWQVTAIGRDGTITAQHVKNRRVVELPAAYVAASVELGYACTIHTAQGVTADSSHTLLTGGETRQLAYTAATRGRGANHLYLEVVGDGNEHNIIRPESTHPATAVDVLEQILARDDSARSATTIAREDTAPATLLADAAARYTDGLYVGAAVILGAKALETLDEAAESVVPDVTRANAWPTLRAHLVLLSAHGVDPIAQLQAAATGRELDTAGDVASVLDWRLDDTGLRNAGTGPLPWLPGIPAALTDDPQWGPYLAGLAAQVRHHATDVAQAATSADLPAWARQGQARPDPALLADIAVWRAATAIPETDPRPTGAAQDSKAPRTWQIGLNARLAGNRTPALAEWAEVFDRVLTHPRRDPFTPLLAERLAALSRAGLDAPTLLRRALAGGPLPDEHNAAALWWRIAGHLSPAVAAAAVTDHTVTTAWTPRLAELLSDDLDAALQASSWWPTLVATIDHALARGARLEDLLTDPTTSGEDVDPAQALVWRISVLTDPPPIDEDRDHRPGPGDDHAGEANPFWEDDVPTNHVPTDAEWVAIAPAHSPADDTARAEVDDGRAPAMDTEQAALTLALAAATRPYAGVLDPSDHEIETALARAHAAETAPVSPERILELNRLTLDYYTAAFPGSWARTYLADRLGTDLTGDPHARPGYAPGGWTHLVTHLRRLGADDDELIRGRAGQPHPGRPPHRQVPRPARPSHHRPRTDGQPAPLGFVARANPTLAGAGTKYLNTPDTVLFHKGAQLYIAGSTKLDPDTTPVLVEGPMDALAVTVAGNGRYVGMAPLGTSLTEEQAAQLARISHQQGHPPVIATDADLPGQVAAHRDYWLLTQHNLAPQAVTLRPGTDPADLLADDGATALRSALTHTFPLSHALLNERLTHLQGITALRHAVVVAAAAHPREWANTIERTAQSTGIPAEVAHRELAGAVRQWDTDPRRVVAEQIAQVTERRGRPAARPAGHPGAPSNQPHQLPQASTIQPTAPRP